jgi:hypothetical protein
MRLSQVSECCRFRYFNLDNHSTSTVSLDWPPVGYFVQRWISGPQLDRIDIHLDVPRIPHEQLSDRRPGELSATIQERVERARAC